MPFRILANLDVEARWGGGALPAAVAARVSAYGALLAALAPPEAGAIEVCTPAAVDAARIAIAGVTVVPAVFAIHARRPPVDLAWADAGPLGRAANDRRFALAVATELGRALPGAHVATTVDAVPGRIVGPWIAKAPWTAAGRDRARGEGAPTAEQRAYLGKLVQRGGAVVVEPWCERLVDTGVCATVRADGRIDGEPPHTLLTDARGTFVGIDLAPPALEPSEHAALTAAVHGAGLALARLGYAGPFAIDAFAYRAPDGTRRFHPLCEINARYTFGWIARALASRHGITRLGFTNPAPPGATVLITPAADGVIAWCA